MSDYNDETLKESIEDLKKLKNVTIRGIDSDVYEDFSSSIKSLNRNIGEAVTQMMKDILQDFDGTFPTLSSRKSLSKLHDKTARISHHDRLSISKSDLEEAGMSFAFQHIDKLIFEPDVDLDTFNQYVRDIRHCSRVKIPNFLPKLLLLSRIQFCDKVEVYQVDKSGDVSSSSDHSSEEE